MKSDLRHGQGALNGRHLPSLQLPRQPLFPHSLTGQGHPSGLLSEPRAPGPRATSRARSLPAALLLHLPTPSAHSRLLSRFSVTCQSVWAALLLLRGLSRLAPSLLARPGRDDVSLISWWQNGVQAGSSGRSVHMGGWPGPRAVPVA